VCIGNLSEHGRTWRLGGAMEHETTARSDALEADEKSDESDLGDAAKTKGTYWINPDTQP
jgi:hypothetical protein